MNVGGPRVGTGVNGDLIGVPVLTPNYFFDIAQYTVPPPPTPAELVREIRDEYHDPAPSKVAAVEKTQGLRTIANVYASNYSITLVGEEPVDGHADYHLKLQPLRDPGKHRLRDLWADESTYDVDKLRVAGNFIDRGTLGVPWMVTFATVDHARYIASETTERGILHWYDRISIAFEDLVPSVGPFYPAHGAETTIREP